MTPFLGVDLNLNLNLDDGRPSGRYAEQMYSCNTSVQMGCADDAM